MPLPQPLQELTVTPQFWSSYLFEEGCSADYPTLAEMRVKFPVCPGYRLELALDEYLCHHSLGFVPPYSEEGYEIGFDDQAHWHPNTLRWEELDLIGRCLALGDPSLPHPGLPVLLLERFTPVCLNTDADAVFPLLESAWRSLGLFDDRRIDDRVERHDRRHWEFVWTEGPQGWTIGQAEGARERTRAICYTLRSPGSDVFPFQWWGAFLESAERHYTSVADPLWLTRNGGTAGKVARALAENGAPDGALVLADALEEAGCEHPTLLAACRSGDPARFGWVLELLLGTPRGEVIRRLFGPTPRVRRTWHRFRINWPEPAHRPAGTGYAGVAVARAIQEELDARGLIGSAGVSGSMGGPGRGTHSFISIRVRDDLGGGIAAIRAALVAQNAPADLAWWHEAPEGRPIPLNP